MKEPPDTPDTAEERVKLEGKSTHTIDFEALDEKMRERLIECIKRKGKISVVLQPVINVQIPDLHAGFKQLID